MHAGADRRNRYLGYLRRLSETTLRGGAFGGVIGWSRDRLLFPRAGFKKKAAEWKGLLPDFVDKPFDDVKKAMVGLTTLSIRRI